MPNLNINTGVIRITINDDPARVISFNPSDLAFAERFEGLLRELTAKQGEYERRAAELDKVTAVDDMGLPINAAARLAFLRETIEYVHSQIDVLFGAGTSQTAFEGVLGFEMITQFLEGVTPYVKQARSQKVEKYAKPVGIMPKLPVDGSLPFFDDIPSPSDFPEFKEFLEWKAANKAKPAKRRVAKK